MSISEPNNSMQNFLDEEVIINYGGGELEGLSLIQLTSKQSEYNS